MSKRKAVKVGGSVVYVNTQHLRNGKSEHKAKVQVINDDGSLSLLVNFDGVGRIPFAVVPPMQPGLKEFWR